MKVLILITAFNVERFIEKVILRLPNKLKKSQLNFEILIIDDASNDNTLKKIISIRDKYKDYKITCLSNKVNLGYGGNQKIGYHYAIKNNFDYIILLHGDGQYAPEKILDMLDPLINNNVDVVQGSRMIKKIDALKGKMPIYKFIGNVVLTLIQNFLTRLNLSEYHSGYRSYKVSALKEIPFHLNSNQFHFDTQILIQLSIAKKKIYEIPIPTFYGKEISSLNSIQYGFAILGTTFVFFLQKFGIFYDPKFNFLKKEGPDNYESKVDFLSTHSIAYNEIRSNSKILSIGCGNAHLEKKLIKDKKCQVDGIDFVNIPNLNFLNSFSVVDLDKDNIELKRDDYDCILLLDVIEHIKDPEKLISDLGEKMSNFPKMKLIISTPNVANIIIRIMLLFGNFNYGLRGILDKTHTRLFTLSSFKKLIMDQNFEIEKVYFVPPPFLLVIKNKLFGNFLISIFAILNKIRGKLFAFQFLNIVKAKPNLEYLLAKSSIDEDN